MAQLSALTLLLAALFTAAFPLQASTTLANGRLQLHFLNIGQGDAAVIVSPHGQVVVVDNGVANQCAKPVSYLQALGVTAIEYNVASHYHADHIGCTEQIVATAPLLFAAVDRGGTYPTQIYQHYATAVASKRQTVPTALDLTA